MSKPDGGVDTRNIKRCAVATSDKTRGAYSKTHSVIGEGGGGAIKGELGFTIENIYHIEYLYRVVGNICTQST